MNIRMLFYAPLRNLTIVRFVEFLVLLGLFVGVWYAYSFASVQRSNFVVARQEVERLPETENSIAEVQSDIRQQADSLQRLSNMIIDVGNPDPFLRFLEERATKHRVTLEVQRVTQALDTEDAPVPLGDDYTLVQLDVVVNGTTSGLLEFLHDVEHAPYLVAVPDWELHPSKRVVSRGSDVTQAPEDNTDEIQVVDDNQLVGTIQLIARNNGS